MELRHLRYFVVVAELNNVSKAAQKSEELQTYPICVAVAPSHALARGPAVSLKRLLAEKLVAYSRSDYGEYHAMLEQVFAPLGRTPEVIEECVSAIPQRRGRGRK